LKNYLLPLFPDEEDHHYRYPEEDRRKEGRYDHYDGCGEETTASTASRPSR